MAIATLSGYLIFNSYIGTVLRLMRIYIHHFGWALLVVLTAGCWLLAWIYFSCIDEFVLGFKSVEELYPSSPLGVDSANTSQLPKEKNLLGHFH